MKLSKDEEELIIKKREKEQKEEIKKDKKYIEASKKLMFAIMLLVFIVFFVNIYLSLKLKSEVIASNTLDRAIIFATPVLTVLIAKSGFENRQKGKIRENIIKAKIENSQDINLGAEDFRNSI